MYEAESKDVIHQDFKSESSENETIFGGDIFLCYCTNNWL